MLEQLGSWIDVLIPLVAGVLLLLFPGLFLKKDASEARKALFQKIGCVLIGVAVLYLCSKAMTGSLTSKPDIDLKKIAQQINTKMPLMIDEETMGFRVTADENEIIYDMKIIHSNADEIEVERFKTEMGKNIKADAPNNPNVQVFLKEGIGLRFNYFSKDDVLIASIPLKPEDKIGD